MNTYSTSPSETEARHGFPGARRTFGGMGAMSGPPCSIGIEEPAPPRPRERADARAAHGRVPEQVVVDVRRERRPHHQGRVQQQALQRLERSAADQLVAPDHERARRREAHVRGGRVEHGDRKSTRLNSSHSQISYAVFCLKKKKEAE